MVQAALAMNRLAPRAVVQFAHSPDGGPGTATASTAVGGAWTLSCSLASRKQKNRSPGELVGWVTSGAQYGMKRFSDRAKRVTSVFAVATLPVKIFFRAPDAQPIRENNHPLPSPLAHSVCRAARGR